MELIEIKREVEDRFRYGESIDDMIDILKILKEDNIIIVWACDPDSVYFSGAIEDQVEPTYHDAIYIDKRSRNKYYLLLKSAMKFISTELICMPSDLAEELFEEHFKKLVKLENSFKEDNPEGWFFKLSAPYSLEYEFIDIINESNSLICKGLVINLNKEGK